MSANPRKKRSTKGPIVEPLLPDPVNPISTASPQVDEVDVVQKIVPVEGESVLLLTPQELSVPPQEISQEKTEVEADMDLTAVEMVSPNLVKDPIVSAESPQAAVDLSLYRRIKSQHVYIGGIDNPISSQVRVFLQKLGLDTYHGLSQRRNGESILEQWQQYHNGFEFAVVVLTPDEMLVNRKQTTTQGLLVSYQETVFALGFLVGKLGKSRVAVFYEEDSQFKRPTQFFDLLYTAYDQHGLWQKRLLNQLYGAGLLQEAALA